MFEKMKTETEELILKKNTKKAKSVDLNAKNKKGPQINSYEIRKNKDGTLRLKDKVIQLEIGKKKILLNIEKKKSLRTPKKYIKNCLIKSKKIINKEEIKKLFLNPFLSKSKNSATSIKNFQSKINSALMEKKNFINFPAQAINPIFQQIPKNKNSKEKKSSMTSLKQSIYIGSEMRLSNFYEKMVQQKDNGFKEKNKHMFSSQKMRRSVSLKRSRQIEEINELFNLNLQTQRILKNEDEYLKIFQKNLNKEKDFFFEVTETLKNNVIKQIEDFGNSFLNLCENYSKEFFNNFKVFKNLVKDFRQSEFKISSNLEDNDKTHSICNKLKIIYYDEEKKKKKVLKEENINAIMYLNKMKAESQKRLINFFTQNLKKSLSSYPKFAFSKNSKELVSNDILSIQKKFKKQLKNLKLYFSSSKLPPFDSVETEFSLDPLISISGKNVFYNKFNFETEKIKKMDSISSLKCLNINDKKQLFLGFKNGKIIHFDPIKKKFKKELLLKNHSIETIAHINTYEHFLKKKENFSNVFYQTPKKILKSKNKKEYLISYCKNEKEKKIILWDLLTSSPIKNFKYNKKEKITKIQILRDNYTFYTISQYNISFYELGKSEFIQNLEFPFKITACHLFNDLSHILVASLKNIYLYQILYAFNPNYNKIGFKRLDLKKKISVKKKILGVNEISFPEKRIVFLEKNFVSFLNPFFLEEIHSVDLGADFRDFRVLEDPIEQKSFLILFGFGVIKVFDLKKKVFIRELDIFGDFKEEKDVAKISNIVFWNFKKSLKILFLDESKDDNSMLFEYCLS